MCTILAYFLKGVSQPTLWEDKGPKLWVLPFREDLHLLPARQCQPTGTTLIPSGF